MNTCTKCGGELNTGISCVKCGYENRTFSGLVSAPGSIHHGAKIKELDEITLLRLEVAQMSEFIEFLFDQSGHIDHITQTEAWAEFEKWREKVQVTLPAYLHLVCFMLSFWI